MAYVIIKRGNGAVRPHSSSGVSVHYTGWTTDGKMIDSSYKRGKPTQFPLRGLITGWREGLQLMAVGDRFLFWIPEALAYQGRPRGPAGMLVFDIELLGIR